LTQAAFAHRVGVSRGIIGQYEAGTLAPRARTLDRIAKIGGVTADWLLTHCSLVAAHFSV